MITIPHNFEPLEWHKTVLANPARYKVIVAHRKARKTTLAINELIRQAFRYPGTYWYVAPKLNQAKKIVWNEPDMLQQFLPNEIWQARNASELFIPFPNGSKLYILGANSSDSLRGPNPRGVVLDEYDDMDPSIWSAIIQPIMTANPNAWCWFSGTYKGKKDLYNKHRIAQDSANWYTIVLKASESGIIDPESLAEAKRSMPQALYDMEMECVPIESGTGFFTHIRESMWHGKLVPTANTQYQIGVDLAKYNDWTVLTPVDLSSDPKWGTNDPFMVGIPERFNQIDWTTQKSMIMATWARYNRARLVLDATGVGNPIVDDLISANIKPVEAFTFTEKSRMDLLKNAQLMIAQNKVRLPDYPQLLEEMESMSYDVTKNHRTIISVPDGQHDDCIMSLCLALWKIKKRVNTAYTTNQWMDVTDQLWKG